MWKILFLDMDDPASRIDASVFWGDFTRIYYVDPYVCSHVNRVDRRDVT